MRKEAGGELQQGPAGRGRGDSVTCPAGQRGPDSRADACLDVVGKGIFFHICIDYNGDINIKYYSEGELTFTEHLLRTTIFFYICGKTHTHI